MAGRRAGTRAHRHVLSGAGFDGGQMWPGARGGAVVDVIAPAPRHPGYKDFRLILTGRSQGADAWSDLLTQHWAGGPEN